MSDVPWGNETERADYWLSEWKTEHAENKRLTAKLNALEVDAEPVVRGEWVAKKHAGDMAIYGGCSECGYEYNQSYFDGKNFKVIRLRGFSFCPNCGAKMESEGEA